MDLSNRKVKYVRIHVGEQLSFETAKGFEMAITPHGVLVTNKTNKAVGNLLLPWNNVIMVRLEDEPVVSDKKSK